LEQPPRRGQHHRQLRHGLFSGAARFAPRLDVNRWDEIKPLGHAPYDTEINQTYGFAAQPFRDALGNVIADNTDLAGTCPSAILEKRSSVCGRTARWC
jgi:hypothetical protein